MRRENNLVLFWKPVQYLTGCLLQLRMQIYLWILYHDNTGYIAVLIHISLKQWQNIYTLGTGTQGIHRVRTIVVPVGNQGIHDKQILGIQLYREFDILLPAAVSYIVTVETAYKLIHVELHKLKLMQLCRLKYAQFIRCLLWYILYTPEASVARSWLVIHADGVSYSLKRRLCLDHEYTVLDLPDISCYIKEIHLRKNLFKIQIVLVYAIRKSDIHLGINHIRKRQ